VRARLAYQTHRGQTSVVGPVVDQWCGQHLRRRGPVACGSALVAFHAWIVRGPGVGAGGAWARRHARGTGSRWHHLRRVVRRRQRGERLLRARPQRLRSPGRAVRPLWGTDHSRVLHEPFLVQLPALSTCPSPLNPGTLRPRTPHGSQWFFGWTAGQHAWVGTVVRKVSPTGEGV